MIGLNVGSGQHPAPVGWVNLDVPWEGVVPGPLQVYADALKPPFPRATFDRLYLGHLLEHFWWNRLVHRGLQPILDVCKRGAEVVVVGPCMRKAVEQDEPKFVLLSILGEGGETMDGIEGPGAHRWVATEALTGHAMRLMGLEDVEPVPLDTIRWPEWPNPEQGKWQACLRGWWRG